jgi:anti-sigma factor RsiW
MIACPNGDVRDLLPDYLHDRLESSARASVERHLAGCQACRDELALLRDLRGTLQRAPRIDVAAVAAAIPAYRPAARQSRAGGWRIAAAIAAIAVGGTSLALLQRTTHPKQVAQMPGASPMHQAPAVVGATTAPTVIPGPTQPDSPRGPALAHAAPSTQSDLVPRGEELAVAGGSISDLSDSELSDLIGDLDSLDALPSTDVESTESLLSGRHRGRHD